MVYINTVSLSLPKAYEGKRKGKEASKWTPCLVKGVLDTPQYCKDPKKKNTISWGIYNYSNHRLRKRKEDVRAICLRHLSAHWSAGLIQLIWLARLAPPSLTTPGAPLLKLHIRWEMKTIPDRGGSVFSQGYKEYLCSPTRISKWALKKTERGQYDP